MTVQTLIHALQQWPADAEVKAQFDINDQDTLWHIVEVKGPDTTADGGTVIIVAS
jgi:hypothetical protein